MISHDLSTNDYSWVKRTSEMADATTSCLDRQARLADHRSRQGRNPTLDGLEASHTFAAHALNNREEYWTYSVIQYVCTIYINVCVSKNCLIDICMYIDTHRSHSLDNLAPMFIHACLCAFASNPTHWPTSHRGPERVLTQRSGLLLRCGRSLHASPSSGSTVSCCPAVNHYYSYSSYPH